MKAYVKDNWVNICMLGVMMCYPFLFGAADDKRALTTAEINQAVADAKVEIKEDATGAQMEQMGTDANQNIAISVITTKLDTIKDHMAAQTQLQQEWVDKYHEH